MKPQVSIASRGIVGAAPRSELPERGPAEERPAKSALSLYGHLRAARGKVSFHTSGNKGARLRATGGAT